MRGIGLFRPAPASVIVRRGWFATMNARPRRLILFHSPSCPCAPEAGTGKKELPVIPGG